MKKISYKKKSDLYNEIRRRINSGFTPKATLEKIKENNSDTQVKNWADEFIQIAEERPIDDENVELDLDVHNEEYSQLQRFEYGAINLALSSGKLENACEELSKYFADIHAARQRVIAKLYYPMFIAIFAAFALHISHIIRISRGEEGAWGAFIGSLLGYLFLLAIIVGGSALIIILLLKNLRHSVALEKFVRKLPFFAKTWLALVLGRYALYFEMSWQSGLTLRKTLAAAASASGSMIISQAGQRMETASIGGDFTLSELFENEEEAFTSDFISGILSAEESGEIAEEFGRQAHFYLGEFSVGVSRLAGAFGTFLTVSIFVIVGYKIIRFYVDRLNNMLEMIGG